MDVKSVNSNYSVRSQQNFNGVILIRSGKFQTLEAALNKTKDYFSKQGIECKHIYPSTSETGLTEYSAMIFTKESAEKFFKHIAKTIKSGYLKIKDKITGITIEEPLSQNGSSRTAQILEFVNGELKADKVQELSANQIVNRQFDQMKWILK